MKAGGVVIFLLAVGLVPMGRVAADERGDLRRLVGDWQGKGVFVSAGGSEPLTMTWHCRRQAKGFVVSCQSIWSGAFALEESEMFGYDDTQKQAHWLTACDGGEVLEAVWVKLNDPRMAEYQKDLASFVVPGSYRWEVFRIQEGQYRGDNGAESSSLP